MARMRGCIWLATGLIVALLAGLVAFVTLNRAAERTGPAATGAQGTAVQVVVSVGSAPVRAQLTAEMLQLKEMPIEAAPQGYLSDIAQASGKITLVDLYPGEPILSPRLLDPNVVSNDGRLALVVATDEVLMAFPAEDLMSKVGVLKPGDVVDILVSLGFPDDRATGGSQGNEEQATFNVLQNVSIAAVVGGPAAAGGGALGQQAQPAAEPEALLLTVSPQNALILKYVKDKGGVIDIVLRAPDANQEYPVNPVDVDFMINRSRIPVGAGR